MRYMVISDIHANLYALQTVLDDAEGKYDKTWFLGDAVGYGPHPNECVKILINLDCLGIAGNHDWATLGKLDTDNFNPDAREALLWTRSVLSEQSLSFLHNLQVSTVEEEHFTLVHGSPRYPVWEYLLYASVASASLDYFSTRFCLVGHTHSAVMFREIDQEQHTVEVEVPIFNNGPHPLPDSRLIINPGSVGQPRDGDPRASYGILDTDNMTFEYRRVPYPISRTQERMRELGFSSRLIARLDFGR
jgi:predicted phosphodiesterase